MKRQDLVPDLAAGACRAVRRFQQHARAFIADTRNHPRATVQAPHLPAQIHKMPQQRLIGLNGVQEDIGRADHLAHMRHAQRFAVFARRGQVAQPVRDGGQHAAGARRGRADPATAHHGPARYARHCRRPAHGPTPRGKRRVVHQRQEAQGQRDLGRHAHGAPGAAGGAIRPAGR